MSHAASEPVPHFALFAVHERDHQHGRILVVRRGKYFGLPIVPLHGTKPIETLFREAVLPIAITTTIGLTPRLRQIAPDFPGEWEFRPARFSVYTPVSIWAIARLGEAVLINPSQLAMDERLQIGDGDFSIDFLYRHAHAPATV
ncbi:MAG TPA: hypothetical protein VF438_01595 [Candidatus Paceibacterota bacterium]